MSAPESLDRALRDGWGDEDFEDFFDETEAYGPVVGEREPDIELVTERVRRRYRGVA